MAETNYPRPQGVRIVRAGGEVIPVEVAFIGTEGGAAVWEISTEVDLKGGDHIEVDALPAHTGIRWPEKSVEQYNFEKPDG